MEDKIGVSQAEYKRFKRAYQRAYREKKKTFEFEGREYVLKYAYYMLEYLDTFYGKQAKKK